MPILDQTWTCLYKMSTYYEHINIFLTVYRLCLQFADTVDWAAGWVSCHLWKLTPITPSVLWCCWLGKKA